MAHLDLKPENILIDDDLKLKICDFGFSQDVNNRITTNKGSDGYKSPEIYRASFEGFDGEKADIFALGVILFIMIFGIPPFTIASKDNCLYRHFYKGA